MFARAGIGRTVKDMVHPVERRPVMPDAFQESLMKEQQMNNTVGNTAHFEGRGLGSRASATEASIVNEIGGGRSDQQVLWYDEAMKRPWLERMFELYRTRLTTEEAVELYGDPRRAYSVSLADLQHPVDIQVDSGIWGSMDQMMVQNMTQLYGTFAADPETSIVMNKSDIVRDAFTMLGLPRGYKYAKSESKFRQSYRSVLRRLRPSKHRVPREAVLDRTIELLDELQDLREEHAKLKRHLHYYERLRSRTTLSNGQLLERRWPRSWRASRSRCQVGWPTRSRFWGSVRATNPA